LYVSDVDLPRIPARNNFHIDYLGSRFGFDNSYAPANLSRDALEKAKLKFFCDKYSNYDDDIMLGCVLELLKMSSVMQNSTILNWDQVIANVNRPKSSGYALRSFINKGNVLEDKRMCELLQLSWNEFRLGYTAPNDVKLKVELRDLERVLAKKTRLYCSCNMEFCLFGLHLFGDMNDKISQNPFKTPFLIGINPYFHWDKLANILCDRESLGYNSRFSDLSNQDNTTSPELFRAIAFFRWCCLSPEHQTFDTLTSINQYYREMSYAPVIIYGKWFDRNGGLMSGSSTTITDNCIGITLIKIYDYVLQCKANGKQIDVQNDLILNAVGDDCADSVPVWMSHEFTTSTFKNVFGMTINIEPTHTFRTGTFLSGNFMYHDELCRWVRAPDRKKIICSIAYYKGKPETYESRICGLLLLSYVYPDLFNQVYNFYVSRFKRVPPISKEKIRRVFTHEH